MRLAVVSCHVGPRLCGLLSFCRCGFGRVAVVSPTSRGLCRLFAFFVSSSSWCHHVVVSFCRHFVVSYCWSTCNATDHPHYRAVNHGNMPVESAVFTYTIYLEVLFRFFLKKTLLLSIPLRAKSNC